MVGYTIVSDNTVQRDDGALIPSDPANQDYQAYLLWLGQGNQADATTLNDASHRSSRIAQVTTLYEQHLLAGFSFGGATIPADMSSQGDVVATMTRVVSGLGLPPGFAWRTAGNTFVPMDQAAFVSFATNMSDFVYRCKANLWRLTDIINQLSGADIDAVDITFGWP